MPKFQKMPTAGNANDSRETTQLTGLPQARTWRRCDFPALPVKMGLIYTVPSPLFAQDDAIILNDILSTR